MTMTTKTKRSVPVLATAILLASTLARAEPPTHEIQKAAPRATVGAPGTASVTVVGKNGWHVNQEAPITVSLKADPAVTLPKPKLARADLAQSSQDSARFDIPFSAATAGKQTITAECKFVMCQAEACKPVKETVALDVEIAAAAPPAPAKPDGKKKSPKRATP